MGLQVTESIPDVKGTPNIRDHDGGIYIRVIGDSVMLGGYENNPAILQEVDNDFQFSLYDFDKSQFDVHVKNATDIAPVFGKVGIKSDVCGPESFTPDHKPIIGEDPKLPGNLRKIKKNTKIYNFVGIRFLLLLRFQLLGDEFERRLCGPISHLDIPRASRITHVYLRYPTIHP